MHALLMKIGGLMLLVGIIGVATNGVYFGNQSLDLLTQKCDAYINSVRDSSGNSFCIWSETVTNPRPTYTAIYGILNVETEALLFVLGAISLFYGLVGGKSPLVASS